MKKLISTRKSLLLVFQPWHYKDYEKSWLKINKEFFFSKGSPSSSSKKNYIVIRSLNYSQQTFKVSLQTLRSNSRPEVFCKKCVLRNFAKESLLKKRLWHRCFPVNFAKFIRTPFLKNISGGCFRLCKSNEWFLYKMK